MIERTLRNLFDYQRFINNEKLNAQIADTQSHLPVSLSKGELAFVNAAGIPEIMGLESHDGSEDKNDPS